MQNFKQTFDRVLMDTLNVEQKQITPDANFKDELGVDSLEMMELIMEFEKQFKIQIPDEAAEEIKTVGDAEKFLRAKLTTTA